MHKLAIDAPVSLEFTQRFHADYLSAISLEARYAVEEALSNCEMDEEGNIISLPVHLALARNPSMHARVCYGSYHTPPAMLPEEFIISYQIDAVKIADDFFNAGKNDENDLIMEIARRLLPEFKRRSNLALMQDAARQSNVLEP
ncbi:MAG: hypothetical protein ACOYXC_04365 [Candidatus Rifleibacteriota bacterium]